MSVELPDDFGASVSAGIPLDFLWERRGAEVVFWLLPAPPLPPEEMST